MIAVAQGHSGLIETARAWFVLARGWLERFPLSVIQLGMRIGIGAVFFNSGLLKINSWEFAVKLFQDEYKVPLLDPVVAAQITAFVELTVPVFLFVGLATLLSTLPLLGMVLVIQTFAVLGSKRHQTFGEQVFWFFDLNSRDQLVNLECGPCRPPPSTRQISPAPPPVISILQGAAISSQR